MLGGWADHLPPTFSIVTRSSNSAISKYIVYFDLVVVCWKMAAGIVALLDYGLVGFNWCRNINVLWTGCWCVGGNKVLLIFKTSWTFCQGLNLIIMRWSPVEVIKWKHNVSILFYNTQDCIETGLLFEVWIAMCLFIQIINSPLLRRTHDPAGAGERFLCSANCAVLGPAQRTQHFTLK